MTRQQPGPLELMAWLDPPAPFIALELPGLVQKFAEATRIAINENRPRQIGETISQGGPYRILADLLPGQRRLKKVHVGV
ncbi:hypothetical protein D3C80_1018640 [compost metagenome]